MPRQNFRRAILRYSTGRKPLFTGFFEKRPARTNFLAQKARHTINLKRAMSLPNSDSYSVAPMLKGGLIKLSKLPFVYTYDSDRPLYGLRSKRFEYSRSLPKGKKYFIYRAPYISMWLDGSKRSFQFWHRLAELTQKYSKACLSPPVPCTSFEIASSWGKIDNEELISRNRLKSKLAEARRFFREVGGIADEFLGK